MMRKRSNQSRNFPQNDVISFVLLVSVKGLVNVKGLVSVNGLVSVKGLHVAHSWTRIRRAAGPSAQPYRSYIFISISKFPIFTTTKKKWHHFWSFQTFLRFRKFSKIKNSEKYFRNPKGMDYRPRTVHLPSTPMSMSMYASIRGPDLKRAMRNPNWKRTGDTLFVLCNTNQSIWNNIFAFWGVNYLRYREGKVRFVLWFV